MNSLKTYLFVTIASIAVISLVSAYSLNKNPNSNVNPSPTPEVLPSPIVTTTPSGETQAQSEANVTVTVKPILIAKGKQPKFEVSFETHSVNLDFDVTKIADLRNGFGYFLGASVWEGTPPGGHHRSGTLTFDHVLDDADQTVSLTFKNIAGVPERVFEIKEIH